MTASGGPANLTKERKHVIEMRFSLREVLVFNLTVEPVVLSVLKDHKVHFSILE